VKVEVLPYVAPPRRNPSAENARARAAKAEHEKRLDMLALHGISAEPQDEGEEAKSPIVPSLAHRYRFFGDIRDHRRRG
jgi:hypothetical protein